jgi:methionyl aminopeptidase
MRRAADVVERALAAAAEVVGVGVPTIDLDRAAEAVIAESGGRAAFKGYRMGGEGTPFPGTLCISVNDVVVHGFPSDYCLQDGDIVSVDCGVELGGYFGDFAYTFAVGDVAPETIELLEATKASLFEGIRRAYPGNRTGDIAYAIQSYCEDRGFGIVTELVGHGVGRRLHEPPNVPNAGRRRTGAKLKAGMTICIEPMINAGTPEVTIDDDEWTVRTADLRPSAHFEHMVHVRKSGPETLSSWARVDEVLERRGMLIVGTSEAHSEAASAAV